MRWIDTVILIDSIAALIIGFLLVLTLRQLRHKNKNASVWTLVAILIGQLGWLTSDGLSSFISIYHNEFYMEYRAIMGGITGLFVVGTVCAAYFFSEYYPLPGRRTRLRLILFSLASSPFAVIVFTPLWIKNRQVIDGVRTGEPGAAFVIFGMWVVAAILAGVSLLMFKYSRFRDVRTRKNIRFFTIGIVLNAALSLLTSFVLPIYGIGWFDFIGPAASLVFISIMLYSITFQGLLDIQTATFSSLAHLVLGLILGGAFYALLFLLLPGRHSWYFWFSYVVLFLGGVGYGRFFKARVDRIFSQRADNTEELLLRLLSGRVFDLRIVGLDQLLSELLNALSGTLGFSRALIIAGERAGRLKPSVLGDLDLPRETLPLKLLSRLALRKLPEDFLRRFDRVFILDRGMRIKTMRDFLQTGESGKTYPRIDAALTEFMEGLSSHEVSLLVPLVLNREISGYMILGEKQGRKPYYANDLKLLDSVRTSIALAVRNFTYYAEIKRMKTRAEAEVEKLAEFIAEREAIQKTIHGRTLLYASKRMEEVMRKSRNAAQAGGQPALILGETGTGKELIARNIHEQERPGKPFIAVNCAAVPASLWEDDIFGHVKGAFTDARADRAGKVEEAAEGTLFFDEIGEMPLEMQAKMLRLLQERVYTPIGSAKGRSVGCRFIFATNRNLEEMIAAGDFRRDLFYRINVFPIELPPLRERAEDIPLLVNHLLEKFAGELSTPVREIEPGAMEALMRHRWPGNIRELENVLIRALAGTEGPVLTMHDLPPGLGETEAPAPSTRRPVESVLQLRGNFRDLVNEYRATLIREALKKCGGNKTRAAEFLGIKRTTLNSQIAELGVGK